MATAHPIPISAETKSVLDRFANYLYARQAFAAATVDLSVGFVRRAAPRIGLSPSHEEIECYIADMHRAGESFGQITNAIVALERFMEFLGRPIHLARPRKPQGVSIVALSEAKVAIMIARTKTLRERALLSVLAYSGIRNRELTELRVRDIDLAQQAVVVGHGKGNKGRICCISGDCVEILGDYLRERQGRLEDFLFVTCRHRHQLQTQDIRKFVRVLARRAGVQGRIWPHLFRHSLATVLLNRGASVYSIQALLGHSDVSTTMEYYLHPSAKNVRADYYRCVPSYV